ncbi:MULTISPECIES: PPE family protein [Mycobacterium]|uniref:PPE family protein n=1 Tax=Mycobacterium TaxID=1763 RepID=UPI00200DBC2C|nr:MULTISPECIES: PPE family protein [Mycobacterium]UQB93476.1 PPE family protein [Mycobacterium intracellulare]WSE45818.1 PPE family protein [Mycobacterium sp. 3-98]
MVLDFSAMPPEITSSLMYAGAGSAPLMAAATAYANLAAEVSATATQWESIISLLTTEQWTGGGSAAAAAAAQPIVSYLTETATTLEQASAQATASAAAYEAAFAATVPPPVIAANRTLLATLVATNFLGVNSAAIAATEAQYAEMWVQDATMMAAYQASSAAAGVLTPVTPLTSTTDPARAAAVGNGAVAFDAANSTSQAAGLDLSSLITSPTSSGGLLQSIDNLMGTPSFLNATNGAVNTAAWWVCATIPNAVSLGHTLGSVPSIPFSLADSVAPAAGAAAITPGTTVGSVSGAGASAALGEASTVGRLSVPAGWNAAAPASSLASATAPLEGSGWTAAAEAEGVTAMPGMPGMAAAAKGAGAYGTGPRYGFKPIVMPKQVVV